MARTGGSAPWRRLVILAVTPVAVLASFSALLAGRAPASASAQTAPAPIHITITTGACSGGGTTFCFSPESANVRVGTQVIWTNQSGVAHTASSCTPTACSGAPANSGSNTFNVSIAGPNGSTGSFTFTSPGTYRYYCMIHGYTFMHGTIAVTSLIQESSSRVVYDGWRGVSDATASGGAYRVSAIAKATAAFTFSGTAITWVTHKGPDQGIASVSIDGAGRQNVDLYAASAQRFSQGYTGLASSVHKIVIGVIGSKNSASSGTNVAVDAFTVGANTTQEYSPAVTYDSWRGASSTSASGGTYRVTASAGAKSSLGFSGNRVDWIAATGPTAGMARVTIDGISKGTVDLYTPAMHWQVLEAYAGLTPGAHTIVVTALGTKNPSSTGTSVIVDAFVIHA